ncbi:ATR-interacting protein [Platysternon megacephalum]|uniref:ATR-interacting protein n=1 Tax=Platysternon megacephalum TaxID=55544 RepID=A0A4D9EEL2_9SAUR|nr:ATR-interacting protein [Platysternon megacephalum]
MCQVYSSLCISFLPAAPVGCVSCLTCWVVTWDDSILVIELNCLFIKATIYRVAPATVLHSSPEQYTQPDILVPSPNTVSPSTFHAVRYKCHSPPFLYSIH